jgi:hypothetical protein
MQYLIRYGNTPNRKLCSTKETDQWKVFWTKALRIVLGLPLYMRSLPPNSPYLSKVTPPEKRKAGRTIVSTNQICKVTCDFRLTTRQRETLERSPRAEIEAAWKWVEGHWRRPPGQGHDPLAPRTVEVKAYIVGEEFMPEEPALTRGARKGL